MLKAWCRATGGVWLAFGCGGIQLAFQGFDLAPDGFEFGFLALEEGLGDTGFFLALSSLFVVIGQPCGRRASYNGTPCGMPKNRGAHQCNT